MPIEDVLPNLNDPEKRGDQWWCFCPVHKDGEKYGKRSMRVSVTASGSVSIKCFAGCDKATILEKLGLSWRDLSSEGENKTDQAKSKRRQTNENRVLRALVDASKGDGRGKKIEYLIRDSSGVVKAVHHRLDLPGNEKRTWWTMPDGSSSKGQIKTKELPMYGSHLIIPGSKVVVCEGEKAASALLSAGYDAVGTVTGASSIPDEGSLSILDGCEVILWPDNDEEGRSHMRKIAEAVFGRAKEVRVFDWKDAPPKGDAADHENLRSEELRKSIAGAPFYSPEPDNEEGPVSFASFTDDLMSLINHRISSGDGVTGIRTGINKLDRGIGGLNKRTMTVIAAATGNGKSLFAGQIALQAALDGHRTLIYTSEQSPVLFLDRYVHYLADVDFFKGLSGSYTEKDVEALKDASNGFDKLPIMVNPNPGSSVSQVYEMVEYYRPELLVVDHLQRMKPDAGRSSRVQELDDISQKISELKNSYNIPIVMSVQVNRAPQARNGKDKRPRITDIRDYSAENDADNVIILYRPHKDDKNEPEDEIQLHCEKGRFGGEWWTRARFKRGQNWIIDYAGERGQLHKDKEEEVTEAISF